MSQRQDYERVAFGIKSARDDLVQRLEEDQRGTILAREKTIEHVKELARLIAVQITLDFHEVNPRFKVEQFLQNALGVEEAQLALTQYEQRKEVKDK